MEQEIKKTWWQSILSVFAGYFFRRQKLKFHSIRSCLSHHELVCSIANKKGVYMKFGIIVTDQELELLRNWSAQAYKDILNKKQGR